MRARSAARPGCGGRAVCRLSGHLGRLWFLGVALPLALLACREESLIDSASDLVVYGGQVWDGTGAGVSGPSLLQISNGRVFGLAPLPEGVDVESAAAQAGATAVDATGRYIVPGLINAHGHVGGTWNDAMGLDYAAYATAELERYARFGVTTVNSLGGDREPSFALRDASWGDGGGPARARLLAAGAVVTGSTPEAAGAATNAVAAMSPDWIKIRVDDNLGATSKMPPSAYAAVIDGAREHGLRVASHLFYHEDAKGLLRAGTGLVAHSIRDEAVDDETVALFHETGVCYVPTLTREVSTFAYGERPDFFDDPFLMSDVDAAQVETVSDPERQARVRASGAAEAYGRALGIAQANLASLVESGVPVAFGTDSGPMGRFQGYFEHMEMELMAQAGLSPEEILRSATGVAAECLGRDDIGTLEAGRRADFIILGADPLEDVTNMRAIEGVWVGGVRVEGAGG